MEALTLDLKNRWNNKLSFGRKVSYQEEKKK